MTTRFWKTRQGIFGFVVGVLLVLFVLCIIKAWELVMMIDPPDYTIQEVKGRNLITMMRSAEKYVIRLKRGGKEREVALDCSRDGADKLIFSYDGALAFFICYYSAKDCSQVKTLSLPGDKESLDNVKIETILTDHEIEKKINSERAWPNQVYAVSEDGNRLLLNISFEDPEVKGKYYMQRPFVYDIAKRTLTLVNP